VARQGAGCSLGGHGASTIPPTPLPPHSSLVAPISVDEGTDGLGRQPGRLGGLGSPPPPLRWHLEMSVAGLTMVAGGVVVSLGSHVTSATPPPRPTPVAPSYAGEERPAAILS
jgi:hypothetical protein